MGKNIGLIIYPDDFKDLLDMSDGETGMVIKSVIRCFQGDETPPFDDRYLLKVYRDITDRMNRAEERYRKKAEAGSKGGKISSKNKQTQANSSKHQADVSKDKQTQANSSNDKQVQAPIPIPKPIPNNNSYVEEIVRFLNERTGKHFQPKGETERLINGRINEGYTVDDFKKVITIKCNEWKDDPKYSRYLQPSTLFAPSHFDEYLNQPEKVKSNANRFTEGVTQRDYNFDELEKKLIKN